MAKSCENCKGVANVYAMDTCSGGWGGYYCNSHIPAKFQITDYIKGENK